MDFARKRLSKEQIAIARSKERDIVLVPEEDNIFKWTGYIKGPPDSPFEQGWFKLKFDVIANYP